MSLYKVVAALTLLVGGDSAPVDPLSAMVELDDADRFAALFKEHDGAPPADALQRDYIDKGGRAIEIFTPGRIRDGAHMAKTVAGMPELYRDAIDRCLPWAREATPQLRSIYLGLQGLLPEAELPRIAVVFGADNSGGTAGSDMQVLGLEVLCKLAEDRAEFDQILRGFFAHETVHSWQELEQAFDSDPFLAAAISEGTADYIASVVTGEVPSLERDQWARDNLEFVWAEWRKDAATIADFRSASDVDAEGQERAEAAYRRWFGNYSSPPEGWPSELGYWVGRQIAAAYVDQADDKRAAIRELLTTNDPLAILVASGLDYRQ